MLQRTFVLLFVLGFGITACTPTDDSASNNQVPMTDSVKSTPETVVPPAVAKDFKGFVNRYSDLELPILIEDENLAGYWSAQPDRKLTEAQLKAFLVGTADFPALGDAPRFASFGRMNLPGGNYLLLTYQFAYGDHIYATTFTQSGQAVSGKKIVSIPEVPEANSMTAVLDQDGSLALTMITPTEFDEEGMPTDFKYEQEAWQITDAGNFEKK
jgi:hypothetical protein